MITPEQKDLAEFIKGVHLSLRRRTQQVGAEKAWEEHLKSGEQLQVYAQCMKELSENFWDANDVIMCRIHWMASFICDYFERGGLEKERTKEIVKSEMFIRKYGLSETHFCILDSKNQNFLRPYQTLDVGSCFNPFKKFDFLKVYPIDLCPATEEVKKCNFVEANTGSYSSDWFNSPNIILPENYFDIVVFSLLLEYLPSPKLRVVACEKAYQLIKPGGILLIATPDSKHATANSKLMKDWKIALASIGFIQVKLEKLKYLYCMAYRKSLSKEYPLYLYNLRDCNIETEKLMKTPQDSVNYELGVEDKTIETRDDVICFDELPYSDVSFVLNEI